MPKFYIYGTLDEPTGLLRDGRDSMPALPAYAHFDIEIDDFVGNPNDGDDIIFRDLAITEISYLAVPYVRRKLRALGGYASPTPDGAMSDAERSAAFDALASGANDASVNAAVKARVGPEWWAKYGKRAAHTADVLLGIKPPDSDPPD
jgi:hypothetical protein